MWRQHLLKLLSTTFDLLIHKWLSSSYLSVVVFSVCVPVAVYIATVVVMWVRIKRDKPLRTIAREQLLTGTIVGFITLMTWAGLIGAALIRSVYLDHQDLVTAKRDAVTKEKLAEARADNAEHKPPQIVTKVVSKAAPCPVAPAQSVSTQLPMTPECRFSDTYMQPDPRFKGQSGTMVLIHCNVRIEAPLCAQVSFDTEDFDNGQIFLPDEGFVMSATAKKQGKVLLACLAGPSLPANHLIEVGVQGMTKKYPRAVSINVGSR